MTMNMNKLGAWSGRGLVLMTIAAGCGDNIIPHLNPDSPRSDAAVRDGSVIDGPVVDGPVIDGPVTDGPVVDGPVVDGSVIDGPVVDGSVIDGSVIDGSVIDGSVIDAGLDAMADAGLDAMADAGPDASGACVQLPVALGAAAPFGVLASSAVTNTGATIVNGDLGVWAGTAISGFGPGVVTGTKYAGTTPAMIAQASLTIAYNDAAGRPPACATLVAGNLGGRTLTAGLYKSTGSIEVSSGNLTLDGGNDPNAVFIFQVASTFTTSSGLQVQLINSAQAKNVFYQLGSSATLGSNSIVRGTIMAHVAIALMTGARLDGRALASTAEVTLDSNVVTVP